MALYKKTKFNYALYKGYRFNNKGDLINKDGHIWNANDFTEDENEETT